MARPSAKSRAAKKALRDKNGLLMSAKPKQDVADEVEAIDVGADNLETDNVATVGADWEVWEEDTTELITSLTVNDILTDTAKHGKKRHYQKDSRTTKWRKNAQNKKVDPKQKLFNFGFTKSSAEGKEEVYRSQDDGLSCNQKELFLINRSYETIVELTTPEMNKKKEHSSVESYNWARYISLKFYFNKRLEGLKKVIAAEKTAEFLWPNNSKSYRAKSIIKWAKEFLEEGKLSDHQQGVHVKRISFLGDNDIKMEVLKMIQSTKPAERSLVYIKKFIDDEIIPSFLGVKGTVSIFTISKYLHEWGYLYRKNKRALFFDGHEREDVVNYRTNWAKRMLEYMERSEFYQGDDQEEVLEPLLKENEQKIVFVTHDESTFYANDGKEDLWLMDGENYIRKKGTGSSIMVSEFQCPCHGTMKIKAWTSRKLFKAGEGRDGWWTHKDMVKQLEEDVLGLFESLHPNCTAVFLFDNSSNHGAYADDALVAGRMTLKEKPWPLEEKYQFRDTKVTLSNGQTIHQTFFYEKTVITKNNKGKRKEEKVRYFKGSMVILPFQDSHENYRESYCN